MFLFTLLAVRLELPDVLRLDAPADRFELPLVLARLLLPFKLFLRVASVLWDARVEAAFLGVLARRRADGVEDFSPVRELARLDVVSEPLAEDEDIRDR